MNPPPATKPLPTLLVSLSYFSIHRNTPSCLMPAVGWPALELADASDGLWDDTGPAAYAQRHDPWRRNVGLWRLRQRPDLPQRYLHPLSTKGLGLAVEVTSPRSPRPPPPPLPSPAALTRDMVVLDMRTLTWRPAETRFKLRPPARHSHTAVAHRGAIYIFGGAAPNSEVLADLWVFTPGREPGYELVRPGRRARLASAYCCLTSGRCLTTGAGAPRAAGATPHASLASTW